VLYACSTVHFVIFFTPHDRYSVADAGKAGGAAASMADYWPQLVPSDNCVIRLSAVKILELLYLVSIGIGVCTSFEDSD